MATWTSFEGCGNFVCEGACKQVAASGSTSGII